MIDIHCHPLPGVDDGAETFEISRAMCQMAAEDGITHLVATPHCNYNYQFRPDDNRRLIVELQAALGDSPRLFLGCDFHLSYDNFRKLTQDHCEFTINNTSYVLVELGDQFIPDHYAQVLYEIELAGLTPILTHPERNPVFRRKPDLLYDWVTRGCLVQITAQSYTGGFGKEAQGLAELWLARNLIHFFATDAHDLKHRPPRLSPCYKMVEESRGQEVAELLFQKNPEAVIHGQPLPYGLKPLGPEDVNPRKRSWFSFLSR